MSKRAESNLPYPIGQQTPKADLGATIKRVLKEFEVEIRETKTDIDVVVQPDDLLKFVTALRDRKELAFDFLRNIAGVDLMEEGMAVKYHLYSFRHGHSLQITVPTSAGHPKVPSLTSLYRTANWHEREAHEMFGFEFVGHPNLKNLLLEDDLHIHPLLKAHPLQAAEILQGIESGPPGFNF